MYLKNEQPPTFFAEAFFHCFLVVVAWVAAITASG